MKANTGLNLKLDMSHVLMQDLESVLLGQNIENQ